MLTMNFSGGPTMHAGLRFGIRSLGGLCLAMLTGIVQGFTFSDDSDGLQGAFDTTVSYGLSMRVQEPKPELQATSYGNRLFDQWDLFSNILKVSHDFSLKAGESGLFVRGFYFYDERMDDKALRDERSVKDAKVRDAFVYSSFLDGRLKARLGSQVISWGENAFISSGISEINTIDVTQARQPGVELKELFIATPAIHLAYAMSDKITVETFYLLKFDKLQLDPSGSLFATLDAIAPGGGHGLAPDGVPVTLFGIPRAKQDLAKDSGQWGVALHYNVPELGNGYDFGAYYLNVHDHNPSLSALAGSGTFHLDYAENVERWGLSFNTLLGAWAVSGEYSYKRNAALQKSDFIAASLGLLPVPSGTHFSGFDRTEKHQLQFYGLRQWGPHFGADQFDLTAEIALSKMVLPSDTGSLLTAGADTYASGYVASFSATFNRALFGVVNIVPTMSLSHDFMGTAGDGSFIQGRKAMTLGGNWTYKDNWDGSLNYTAYWGAGRANNIRDRDFVAVNLRYRF